MTRESGHAAHFVHVSFEREDGARQDRISDLARIGWPDRDRIMGGIFVSAEINPFIPRPRCRSRLATFSAATRSAIRPDDLTMDHADTAPCEYLWPCEERCEERERPLATPGPR
jgi:hypothetical protein